MLFLASWCSYYLNNNCLYKTSINSCLNNPLYLHWITLYHWTTNFVYPKRVFVSLNYYLYLHWKTGKKNVVFGVFFLLNENAYSNENNLFSNSVTWSTYYKNSLDPLVKRLFANKQKWLGNCFGFTLSIFCIWGRFLF